MRQEAGKYSKGGGRAVQLGGRHGGAAGQEARRRGAAKGAGRNISSVWRQRGAAKEKALGLQSSIAGAKRA